MHTITLTLPKTDPSPPVSRGLPTSSPASTPVDRDENGVEPRTIVLIAGSVLTATAVGLGVGFMFKANAAKDDAEAARARAVQGADPDRIANDSYCVDGIPNRSPACDDLTEKVDEWNTARSIAAGSFIAAGAIGLSTAAAYFFWPDKSPSADRRARIRITPVIGSSQRGLSAELSF